jgi:hypothetical protein
MQVESRRNTERPNSVARREEEGSQVKVSCKILDFLFYIVCLLELLRRPGRCDTFHCLQQYQL